MNEKYPFNGEMLTLIQISAITGVSRGTLYNRYKRGWTPDMVSRPSRRSQEYKFSIESDEVDAHYTEKELYELFRGFAGNVSAREEYRILADFMGKETIDKEVSELVKHFRKIYKQGGKAVWE